MLEPMVRNALHRKGPRTLAPAAMGVRLYNIAVP